jgi:hypothetical protein
MKPKNKIAKDYKGLVALVEHAKTLYSSVEIHAK